MFCTIFFTLLLLIGVVLVVKRVLRKKPTHGQQRFTYGTHVIISGGSKGIGKSLAKKFAELGTHVTIIARNESDLRAAKVEIEKHRRSKDVQEIRTVSLDLTKLTFPDSSTSDISSQQGEILNKIMGEHERCDILVNCCGSAIPARFDDISQEQFHYMMEVNYFSAVNLTRLLLPVMKIRSLNNQSASKLNGGRIVFVSSICGLLSFFGYSAYSASKFAIVGLAQALQMELKPYDISVTVSFPPDTDTPGYEEENKIKPALTLKMSESGNVYSADDVAQAIINDVRSKKFCSTVGLENRCVLMATNTFMPYHSIYQAIFESLFAGPLKLAGYFIVRSWYKMVSEAAPNEIIRAEIALNCSKNSKHDDKSNN